MLLDQLKLKVVLTVAMRILEKEVEPFSPTYPPTPHRPVSMALVWQENSSQCHVLGDKSIHF